MKRRKSEKGFDTIEFKRKVQAAIYEEIKGLSPEQEMEYFRRQATDGPLGKWWKALERHSRRAVDEKASSTETRNHQLTTK